MLEQIKKWSISIENTILAILFCLMIFLAISQIILRIFFSSGLVWADELIKFLVLWISLIASISAVSSDRHLRIDLVSHFIPKDYFPFIRIVIDLFSSIICGLVSWQAYRFLRLSIEFQETVLVNIPAWIIYLVLPFAFLVMSYRFFLSFCHQIFKIYKLKKL